MTSWQQISMTSWSWLAFITANSSLEPLLEKLFQLLKSILILVWRGFGRNRTGDLRITQISQVPHFSPLSCVDGCITEDSWGHSKVKHTHLTQGQIQGFESRPLRLKNGPFSHSATNTLLRLPDIMICVCVFTFFVLCLCFCDTRGLQVWIPVCNLVVTATVIPLLLLTSYCHGFLAVSEILSNFNTYADDDDCFYHYKK